MRNKKASLSCLLKNDIFNNWNESIDFKNIEKMVNANVKFNIPIFPLKFSKVFDLIFEKEKSINQMMEEDALSKYTYREVAKQFDNIYLFIEKNYAAKNSQKILISENKAQTRKEKIN